MAPEGNSQSESLPGSGWLSYTPHMEGALSAMKKPRKKKLTKLVSHVVFCFWFLVFSRQGFSVALVLVLELAFIDQAGLKLRAPLASAS